MPGTTSTALRPLLIAALAVSLVACAHDNDTADVVVDVPEGAGREAGPDPEPSNIMEVTPHSSSVPGTMNQIAVDQQIPNVTLDIVSPRPDEVLASGERVVVQVDLKGYRTGKEIGQHVHIILDNEPYKAHYDADEPFVFEDVAPGTHTLRIFPARHYHLSLKENPQAVFETVVFHVERKTEGFAFDPTRPFITYSRPKGSYDVESAKALLLDFYVSNATLGDDYQVVYTVDGQATTLETWQPVLLPPLSPGQHTIGLKLVDGEGNLVVNGGYNDTTRTITVTAPSAMR